jgi:nitrogenase molybdenum-iron protein alpha chain
VELPYTKWWQNQDDPFILSKEPEVLDKALKDKLNKKKGA